MLLLPVILLLELGSAMSVVAVRAEGAVLALVPKPAHHGLILARVGRRQSGGLQSS